MTANAIEQERIGVEGRRRSLLRRIITHTLLIAFAITMIYPLLWMLSSSFKPYELIFTDPGIWPSTFTVENYREGWSLLGVTFGTFLRNSFVLSILAVIGNMFACSLAAYAFARMEFRFRKTLFALMLMTIMLPFHVTVVPQYIIFHHLGWIDTFLPILTPKFLAVEGFFVFLLVQFIRGLPRDLDDAAEVDGAGPFQTYWRVILPLCKPGLAVVAIFTFIWTWNDFFTQLLYLTSPGNYTVPLGLRAFLDATGRSHWGSLFAMSVLALGPIRAERRARALEPPPDQQAAFATRIALVHDWRSFLHLDPGSCSPHQPDLQSLWCASASLRRARIKSMSRWGVATPRFDFF
jgi:multiple sugar transport system permease protein